MYAPMKDMLWHAHENHYAIMAINMVSMEQTKACVESTEGKASAATLSIPSGQMKAHAYPCTIAPMIKSLAETVRVPVTLNIDHGINTEDIETAIHCDHSNVMVDASSHELKENIHRVRAVVTLTHDRGISVGAELEHAGVVANADSQNEDYYVNMAQAEGFVEWTGCDCPTVAIGTAHGSYLENTIPKLDFERLRGLKEKLNMPLILHGGSGAGEENMKKAVLYRISKVSVCTDFMDDIKASMLEILEEQPNIQYMEMNETLEKFMKRFIKRFMRMVSSSGWYAFERDNGPELD